MQRLSERFSSPLLSLDNPDGELETTYYLFPSSEDLPTQHLEAILRELGFGYRARYLESTLSSLRERGIVEDELRRWRSLPMEEVRKELIMLKGVGRKVADCVMLMCMDQVSSGDEACLTFSTAFVDTNRHAYLCYCSTSPPATLKAAEKDFLKLHLR